MDPSSGFVTGGGWYLSPPGAFPEDPSFAGEASFGLVAKHKSGRTTPEGNIQFSLRGIRPNFTFKSKSYEWLVVTDSDCAKFYGTGSLTSDKDEILGFMVTVCDVAEPAAGQDTFHIKMWQMSDGSIVYDNLPGFDNDASFGGTLLEGGNIQIHAGGHGSSLRG